MQATLIIEAVTDQAKQWPFWSRHLFLSKEATLCLMTGTKRYRKDLLEDFTGSSSRTSEDHPERAFIQAPLQSSCKISDKGSHQDLHKIFSQSVMPGSLRKSCKIIIEGPAREDLSSPEPPKSFPEKRFQSSITITRHPPNLPARTSTTWHLQDLSTSNTKAALSGRCCILLWLLLLLFTFQDILITLCCRQIDSVWSIPTCLHLHACMLLWAPTTA